MNNHEDIPATLEFASRLKESKVPLVKTWPLWFDQCAKMERERDIARKEVERWESLFIPFAAVHAVNYGEEHFGKNMMFPGHYDLLKEAGARMDDFIRADPSGFKHDQTSQEVPQ